MVEHTLDAIDLHPASLSPFEEYPLTTAQAQLPTDADDAVGF
jgi:hypothetical protein